MWLGGGVQIEIGNVGRKRESCGIPPGGGGRGEQVREARFDGMSSPEFRIAEFKRRGSSDQDEEGNICENAHRKRKAGSKELDARDTPKGGGFQNQGRHKKEKAIHPKK